MEILINDAGTIWSPHGQPLPRPPLLGPGALADATNRGVPSYVRLQIRRVGATLRLDEGPLTRACFERLVWLLVTFRVERVIIESSLAPTGTEILAASEDIFARLDEIRGATPGESARPAFFMQRMALARLDEQRREPMHDAWRTWTKARGKLSVADLKRESGEVNGKRTLLRIQRDDRLETNAVSDVVGAYLPCQRMTMLGREIEDQPDAVYGEWLASAYRTLAQDTKPEAGLQLVEAVVTGSGGRMIRARYERLLLPWRSAGGDRWITSQPLLRIRHVVER
jgi:hypothetical protein